MSLVLGLVAVLACEPGAKPAEWTLAGLNLSNTRHQESERVLSRRNVPGLKPRWVFSAAGSISATPAVEAGAVYFPDWGGKLWKLEARSGRVLWSHAISEYTGVPDSVSRVTPAVVGNRLILGSQQGGHLIALDKHSGELLWKTQVDPHPAAVITQSPIVHDGRVYVGVSSMEEAFTADPSYVCCTFRGSVVAVDLATGERRWQAYMVPEGYSGGAVWSNTLVVDTKRNSLYVTTGNNYEVPDAVEACIESSPPEAAESCLATEDYIDAFVSLDLDSGAVKWGRRLQGFDAWNFACSLDPQPWCPSPVGPDYDFGQGVMLFTANTPGGGKRELIGAGQKSGIFWALDPDSGAVVWNKLVGPGGSSGGIMWGSATDGERIYVGNVNWNKKPHTLVSGERITWGSWTALDAATGEILWQKADPQESMPMGPVTVANGVVYAGSLDAEGHMYALDARTGETLWDFTAGGSVNAGAAVVEGSVYWGSGYGRFGMGTANDKFFAFSLE
ncbi:PQQ-binding-like beta-propeller repeat protein [Archangium gephyra]|nr:PQQ-binding-like beta-propeller repeat protein [Archangium gephyra]AKJ07503.1 putative polyvinyl-alcohol dehydrogenase [Archangium gephyra]